MKTMLLELNEKEANMLQYCVLDKVIRLYNDEKILNIIRNQQIEEHEDLLNKLKNKERYYVKNV